MAIYTELWAADIAEKLMPNNSHVNQAINDDAWVVNNKVHLPQAGDLPVIAGDAEALPLAVTPRTDDDLEYPMKWFRTRPTIIQDIEEVETNYAKRTSVTDGHAKQINKAAAQFITHAWSPTTSEGILRTSGDAVASQVNGATGDRKALTLEDVLKAKAVLDDMDVDPMGRSMLIPAYMYNNILEKHWKDLTSMDKTGEARIQGKNLLNLFGFTIYTRGKKHLLTYTNAATPALRAYNAGALATANAYALFWHKDFVRRAKGQVKALYDDGGSGAGKPEYHGSLFSANVRAGGSKAYSDGTGVVAIVESAV